MICPGCHTEMIKAKATEFGEEYDYCRSCKKELSEFKAIPIIYGKPVATKAVDDFKKGDRVECVDNHDYAGKLTVGKVYLVEGIIPPNPSMGIDKTLISFIADNGYLAEAYASRFVSYSNLPVAMNAAIASLPTTAYPSPASQVYPQHKGYPAPSQVNPGLVAPSPANRVLNSGDTVRAIIAGSGITTNKMYTVDRTQDGYGNVGIARDDYGHQTLIPASFFIRVQFIQVVEKGDTVYGKLSGAKYEVETVDRTTNELTFVGYVGVTDANSYEF